MKISELLMATNALFDYKPTQNVIAIVYTKDDLDARIASILNPFGDEEARHDVEKLSDKVWDKLLMEENNLVHIEFSDIMYDLISDIIEEETQIV